MAWGYGDNIQRYPIFQARSITDAKAVQLIENHVLLSHTDCHITYPVLCFFFTASIFINTD